MTAQPATDIEHPVLAALGTALDQAIALSADDLEALGPDGLIRFVQGFESVRNRLALVDHEIVAALDESGAVERSGHRSTAALLNNTVRVSLAEARSRVRAAEALRATRSMTGEPVAAKRAVLAEAAASGAVTAEIVDVALRAMERAEKAPDVTAEQIEQAETLLADQAGQFTPREFRVLAERVIDHLDPDGTLADDRAQEAKRSFGFWWGRDGMVRVEGRLTAAVGQKLKAVLDPLSKLQPGPDGIDARTVEERRHDGLEAALDRLLRAGGLPVSGGTPATVIITITEQDLRDRTGHGRFSDDTPVAPETVVRVADEADILTVVTDAEGKVLDLGRTNRLAGLTLTYALHARDRGCSFPGCVVPPEYCERHHIVAWVDGGRTCIDNMTLLCVYHHHNFERLRWMCRMINGQPWWIPPAYIDPDRKPMINSRIRPPGRHPNPSRPDTG